LANSPSGLIGHFDAKWPNNPMPNWPIWHEALSGTENAPPHAMTPQELRDRLMTFALAVYKFVRPLFGTADTRGLASQLVDAATSAAANYRAACNDRSTKEWKAKMGVVLEETDESQFWISFIHKAGLASSEREILVLLDEAQQLTRIFAAACRTAKGPRNT
jgi:four helix bundle protein